MIPEKTVEDEHHLGNVQSVPLELIMFSPSSFSIALVSDAYPITSNNTVIVHLFSSCEIDILSADDFLVRNGHVTNIAPVVYQEPYYRYDVTVYVTIQGDFCIDVSAGKHWMELSNRHTLFTKDQFLECCSCFLMYHAQYRHSLIFICRCTSALPSCSFAHFLCYQQGYSMVLF